MVDALRHELQIYLDVNNRMTQVTWHLLTVPRRLNQAPDTRADKGYSV